MTTDALRSAIEDTTKAVLIDDVTEIRYLSRLLLANVRGVQVVGEGANGKDAIELAKRLQPELMVLDLDMPIMTGVEALPYVLEASPATKVIVWSGDPAARAQCKQLGAHTVIAKGGDPQLLVDAVRSSLSPLGARW